VGQRRRLDPFGWGRPLRVAPVAEALGFGSSWTVDLRVSSTSTRDPTLHQRSIGARRVSGADVGGRISCRPWKETGPAPVPLLRPQ
jgi:hypothetical protein